MKIRDYLLPVFAIILAITLSGAAIYMSAYEKQQAAASREPVSFMEPEFMANGILTAEASIEESSEETTEETTEEPSTEPSEETTADLRKYTEGVDDSKIYFTNYRFSTVGTDYFDDAIFIGNSRLQGFILYCKVPNLRSYTYVGMSVNSFFTKATFNIDGVQMTAAEALAHETNFSKVYLKFGINEIGWVSTEQFINEYSKVIEYIYSCNPNAIIFVHSVLPVSHHAIEVDPTLSMERINEYNEALKIMASKYNVCYLDIASIFTGEDGYMPSEYSSDGVHLNANSVLKWLDYILEHGIEEND
ncbi:MAG: GDSL-type esterase/lipase family protein [Lachnospiraceae bacterium]